MTTWTAGDRLLVRQLRDVERALSVAEANYDWPRVYRLTDEMQAILDLLPDHIRNGEFTDEEICGGDAS